MLPHKDTLFPVVLPDGTPMRGTVFLQNAITHPNWEVGDYTYHSTFAPLDDPSGYAAQLAPYLFEGAKDGICIGKFCQIAHGVRIITHGANHAMAGVSTYPFPIFDAAARAEYAASFEQGRDVVIGHDCWLGDSATLLPGTQLGNGVIVGAGAVVGGDVPDFAIVVGNPGRILRMRFEPDTIATINGCAWWDWDMDKINRHDEVIASRDIAALLSL